MIIVEIIGGLGNQMFQYAFGRALATHLQIDLKLDISAFEKYKVHNYGLHHLNIKENIATPADIERFKPTSRKLHHRIVSKITWELGFNNIIQEPFHHYNEKFTLYPDNSYFIGYWQTEKYFKSIEDIIGQEFTIKIKPDKNNLETIAKIKNSNAISLHVRRGDYISNPDANEVHGTCDLSYYREAINYISQKVEDPHFFIFSDDPNWVLENLILDYPATYVTHNNSSKNYEDLRLMSLCKHNIIANSSFSWWGAWLNNNPNKIVIAPKQWFKSSERNTKDQIPDTWVIL